MDTTKKDFLMPCSCRSADDVAVVSRPLSQPRGYGVMCWECLRRTTLWTNEAGAIDAWNKGYSHD